MIKSVIIMRKLDQYSQMPSILFCLYKSFAVDCVLLC
jgi:hypothetical protein